MDQCDAVARVVAPWLDATNDLAGWFCERAVVPGMAVTARHHQIPELLRALLRKLASGGEAIPAEALRPAPDGGASLHPERLWNDAARKAPSAGELHQQRDLLLRFGLWRLLLDLQRRARAENWVENPFVELLQRLAHGAAQLPPGLAPSLPYAGSAAAPAFFNQRLRGCLRRLADLYSPASAAFMALAETAPFEDSGLAVQLWSAAWTAAVAGVYLDHLQRRAAGDLQQALHNLWGLGCSAVRFRAPSDLMVLPTRERNMHLDLWTDLVLAQTLSHQPSRFQRTAAGDTWHRVRIAMHDLGGSEHASQDAKGVRAFVRGLGVEMVYQAVFVHAASAALRPVPQAEGSMVVKLDAPAPLATQAVVLSLPEGCAGQAANLELVVRWQQRDQDRRLCQDELPTRPLPALTDAQMHAIGGWAARRTPPAPLLAHALQPALVGWCAAEPTQAFQDEAGKRWRALGHARLWAAAGEGTEWLELSQLVWARGGWHSLPLCLQDEWIGGELRSWLLVDPAALELSGLDADSLCAALQTPRTCLWVRQHAGLGAFVCCALDLQRLAGTLP